MTKKYVYKKFTWSLVLLNLVAALPGCIGDPHAVWEEKVRGLPNTFRLKGPKSYEKILAVSISRQGKDLWEIRATRDIPAKGFTVTAGEVPEGFEQIIPAPPEKFHPVIGNRYAIFIKTNLVVDPNTSYVLRAPAFWIAE